MRRQRNALPPIHALVLLAALLILPSAASTIGTPTRLRPRDPLEHVVLADCRGSDGTMSSQMAYYTDTPDATPQDVAVVSTTPGQSRIWAGATTKGLFTGTGVTFTAQLGPLTADGDFAGTGENGYADFTCWQRYSLNLYQYDGIVCSQVYDCDHEPVPTSTPTPSSAPSSESGLSQGALIGIICSVVGVLTIAGIAAWIIWRRHVALSRPKAGDARGRGSSEGLFGQAPKTPTPETPGLHGDPAKDEPGAHHSVYEMEAQWHPPPAEVYSDMGSPLPRPEPVESRVELDSKDRQYMQYMGRRR